jgi:hypothetical protein
MGAPSGGIAIGISNGKGSRQRPRSRTTRFKKGLIIMKNCKLCKLHTACNDLPGFCILIPYLTIAVVVVSVGYLFVTQEILA